MTENFQKQDFLEKIKTINSKDNIKKYFDKIKTLKILVIGEAIIDEYQYCDALGKSGKEAMLVMRYLYKERFAGGILAVANHVAQFCDSIQMATYLGSENLEEDFLRSHLKENIIPFFITKSQSPTIVKRRIIDQYSLAKLLGVYEINDELLSENEEDQFCEILKNLIPYVDAVVVTDYGHGLITPRVIDLLVKSSPFLAVNTQINASNIGYHTISKYPKADFVCIHEGELRMDFRSRKRNLEDLVLELANRLECNSILITRGSNGTITYDKKNGFIHCPAFATKVVDRIGAGDAVFAVTSLLAATKTPSEIVNFIGNMVGSQAVRIIGNERAIDKNQLIESIESILG